MVAHLRALLCAATLAAACVAAPTPVIFDTDIGSDFDDSAAIALALSDPSLDVKLIVTATGDTTARAQIVCKYLQMVYVGARARVWPLPPSLPSPSRQVPGL